MPVYESVISVMWVLADNRLTKQPGRAQYSRRKARHVDLIQVSLPVAMGAHRFDALASDLRGEHRTKPVPPVPRRLMADLDPALVQGSSTFRNDNGHRM